MVDDPCLCFSILRDFRTPLPGFYPGASANTLQTDSHLVHPSCSLGTASIVMGQKRATVVSKRFLIISSTPALRICKLTCSILAGTVLDGIVFKRHAV